ncbi:MAG: cell wall hydrolase [Bdellovibrionales bacterium]|nr:cell wall hydrolase [Bdellovibrionales bacterium]
MRHLVAFAMPLLACGIPGDFNPKMFFKYKSLAAFELSSVNPDENQNTSTKSLRASLVRRPSLPSNYSLSPSKNSRGIEGAKQVSKELQLTYSTGAVGTQVEEISQAENSATTMRPRSRSRQRTYPTTELVDSSQLPAAASGQWVKTTANLNLRDYPGLRRPRNSNDSITGPGERDTNVLSLMRRGGRMVVLESATRNGRKWYKVAPIDCNRLETRTLDPNDSPCGRSYWAAAAYFARTDTPPSERVASNEGASAACTNCSAYGTGYAQPVEQNANDVVAAASAVTEAAAYPLNGDVQGNVYEEFVALREEYIRAHSIRNRNRNSDRKNWAKTNRDNFIRFLIEKAGTEKASLMLLALTSYGEAGGEYERNEGQNMAEMAMVATVIQNRAHSNYRTDPKRDLLSNSDQSHGAEIIRVILAKSQFMPWSFSDARLRAMMLGPTYPQRDPGYKRAFEMVAKLNREDLKAVGSVVNQRTRHFYNPKASRPAWRREGQKINAQFEYQGKTYTVKSHEVRMGVR